MELHTRKTESKFQGFNGEVLDFLKEEWYKLPEDRIMSCNPLYLLRFLTSSAEDYTQMVKQPHYHLMESCQGITEMLPLVPYICSSENVAVLAPDLKSLREVEQAFGIRNDDIEESFFFQKNIIKDQDKLRDFLELGKVVPFTETSFGLYKLYVLDARCIATGQIKIQLDTFQHLEKFHTIIVYKSYLFPKEFKVAIKEQLKVPHLIVFDCTAVDYKGPVNM